MRIPILQIPGQQAAEEHRKLLSEAVRQLDRADLYLAAVGFIDVQDTAGLAELRLLRRDLQQLRERFAGSRDQAVE